jgi:hypothetical protein
MLRTSGLVMIGVAVIITVNLAWAHKAFKASAATLLPLRKL